MKMNHYDNIRNVLSTAAAAFGLRKNIMSYARQRNISSLTSYCRAYRAYIKQSKIVVFSTGRAFSRRPRTTDHGAARLARQGVDRGPARREFCPRPRPVALAVRSQSRTNRVSFARDPSGSAVPSRLRETRSATVILEINKFSQSCTISP